MSRLWEEVRLLDLGLWYCSHLDFVFPLFFYYGLSGVTWVRREACGGFQVAVTGLCPRSRGSITPSRCLRKRCPGAVEEVPGERWLFARGANQLGASGAGPVQAPSRSPVGFSLPWHITSPARKRPFCVLSLLLPLPAPSRATCAKHGFAQGDGTGGEQPGLGLGSGL